MKNYFSLLLFIAVSIALQAQKETKIGAKLNYYWPQIENTTPFTSTNIEGYSTVTFDLAEAKQGGGFGIMAQVPFMKIFYIQPELLWDFHTIQYDVERVSLDQSVTNETMKEVYYRVDVPVNVGIKIYGLKAFTGGIARFNIPGKTTIEDNFPEYKQDFNMPSIGWHVGAGIDLGNTIIIDAKYEQSISNFGHHFNFGGESHDLGTKEIRLVLSVGFVL